MCFRQRSVGRPNSNLLPTLTKMLLGCLLAHLAHGTLQLLLLRCLQQVATSEWQSDAHFQPGQKCSLLLMELDMDGPNGWTWPNTCAYICHVFFSRGLKSKAICMASPCFCSCYFSPIKPAFPWTDSGPKCRETQEGNVFCHGSREGCHPSSSLTLLVHGNPPAKNINCFASLCGICRIETGEFQLVLFGSFWNPPKLQTVSL